MSASTVYEDMEIRKLRPAELYTLGQILNISDSWKKLMAIVPKEGTENLPRFNSEHFTMIEQAVHQQRRNAAEIFLEEWGTMGKKRPTLNTLLDLLVKAELFRAADYVAGDILKKELPKRPQHGPAAPVDISEDVLKDLLEKQAGSPEKFDESSLFLGSSSEFNISKIVCSSDIPVNAADSLNKNIESTKLASTNHKLHEKLLGQTDVPKRDMSDLIKFSTNEIQSTGNELKAQESLGQNNHENVLPVYVYEKREISSQELPVCLNEYQESSSLQNQEMKSEDLPLCLNSTFQSSNNDSDTSSSTNESFHVSELEANVKDMNLGPRLFEQNQIEMASAELPQCVLELSQNSGNNQTGTETEKDKIQNALDSQELPVTILEYNKG